MRKDFSEKLKIYNLVDRGVSVGKISRVFEKITKENIPEITDEVFFDVLGDVPKTREIIELLPAIKLDDFISIWSLCYFGVNPISIPKISEEYSTLDILFSRRNELKTSGIRITTLERIEQAFNEVFGINSPKFEKEILDIIEKSEFIQNFELKRIIFNRYPEIESKIVDNVLDSLLEENKIKLTIEGYRIKKIEIEPYLKNLEEFKDYIVYQRCLGATLEECGELLNSTREWARQVIKKRVKKYPVFAEEENLLGIKKDYDLSDADVQILGLNIVLWRYIDSKYEFEKPKKDAIDYLKDKNLCKSEIGKSIFSLHNVIIFENEIIEQDFLKLLEKFIIKENINVFSLLEILKSYNDFIFHIGITNPELFISEENIDFLTGKLEHSSFFLNTGSSKYILYNPDASSFEFIEKLREYLESFEGYGSVVWFFERNEALCKENNFFDENQLFIFMKRHFGEEFKDSISFIRNPTLCKKGIDKEEFIESLLFDIELPCTEQKFLDYIHEKTGLNKASTKTNFYDLFFKHRNSDGLMSIEDDFSEEKKEKLLRILNNRKCIGTKKLEYQVISEYGHKSKGLISSSNLKKIGYVKTNTTVYREEYPNRAEAVYDALLNSELILSEAEVKEITNLDFLTSKIYLTSQQFYIVQIGEQKYLNLVARHNQNAVMSFITDLIEIMTPETIYTISQFIESGIYEEQLEKNQVFKRLVYSYDENEILKFIIRVSNNLYTISNKDSLVFSKTPLTYARIIHDIMNSNEILSLIELREILYSEYGLTKQFSNSDLSNMGFYCPYTSEKVYLSKEHFEYEQNLILHM